MDCRWLADESAGWHNGASRQNIELAERQTYIAKAA